MPFPQRVRLLFGYLSPSKFGNEMSSFADLGCLSRILDPGSWIPDPGSWVRMFPIPDPGSWIQIFSILDPWSQIWIFSIPDPGFRMHIKEFKYFNQKKWFFSSQKYNPGFPSRIRIPDLDPDYLPIPDPNLGSQIPNPGIKKAPDPWSWIPDPDSQHWRFRVCSGCRW